MRRRRILCLLWALTLAPIAGRPAMADDTGPIAPGGPDLKTTLEKGLKARRPEEFAFIKKVVAKVDAGSLPLSLVESTFLWARKKRQPHAFQYFRRALEVRAGKQGISI